VILANKEEVKFFYEMYERMMLPFYYQRFNKSSFISSQSYMPVGDAEFINLQKSLSSGSPYLIQKIKQYNLNSNVYLNFLAGISNNGVGESWQNYIRGYFNTPYIKAKTDNPFVIYDFDSFNTKVSVESPVTEDKISLYLQSTQNNERNLMDVFPFAMGSWFSSQMSYGIGSSNEGIMNTSKTLFLYDSKNLVANFNNENFSSIDKIYSENLVISRQGSCKNIDVLYAKINEYENFKPTKSSGSSNKENKSINSPNKDKETDTRAKDLLKKIIGK
jgi:hypothetical protein